jgi:hypothetical protein
MFFFLRQYKLILDLAHGTYLPVLLVGVVALLVLSSAIGDVVF